MVGPDVLGDHVRHLEQDLAASREPGRYQVLDHLLLAVQGDRATGDQAFERDAVRLPAEPQLDAVVDESFLLQPVTQAGRDERVHRPLLEHASPDPLFHVVPAVRLEHQRIDAAPVQQVREQQPPGPAPTIPTWVRTTSCSHHGQMFSLRTLIRRLPGARC